MVAIVTGKGTGLERSSAFVLGSQGQIGSALLGRDGEGVYVNAANGNLVITRQDEFLIGLGPDISAGRTYNSQGLTDGDNNDGWRASAYRTVTGLSGSYGAAGTTVTRTDWDGSATLYAWDAAYVTPDNITGAYVAKDGNGAYDTLTRGGTTWTWYDGSTQLKETYNESNGGRIATATDTDGNLVDYTFDGNGRIATVKSYNLSGSGDDEVVTYSYTGANLTQIVTSKNGGASTLTRVGYAYESYDSGTKTRLLSVTVDLSPNDNNVGDTYAYTTSYAYKDNVSALVASIGQTDGSLLQIQYDGSNRVSSFTQTIAAGVTRTTGFEYASGGRTIITDPAGQKTVMVYDVATSDLLQISYPPESNNLPIRTVQFAYNANGDVKSVTHGPGNVVSYDYDTHGNRKLDRDSAGNTVERTFSSKNELRRETRYLVADPDGAGAGTPSSAVTTRYAYDDESHLRFEVSAEGFVTEHRYDNEGRRTVSIAYAGTAYDVSALAPTALIDRGPLETWVTNLATKANALRTERGYDFRGNLTRVTSHETLQADGTFLTTSAKTETLYVYDQAGVLLQRTVTNPQAAGTLTESFVYDGLNRMTLATDFYSNVTRTTFLDNRSQTVVTHANGLSSITTFNRGGEIISSSTSNAGANLVDLSGWPGNTQSPPAGNASVPGWLNYGDFINETAWATTTGPDGLPVTAMRAGQTDAGAEGGGNFTNEIQIDGSKAYEFTYYFKLSDLNKHAIYFGLSPGAYVEYAATGADEGNPYFFSSWLTGQEATFTADTWYKVVGYVLPQGAAAPASPLGGVYNAETGAKVANATTFRWNAERANNSVHSRFFNYYGEANQQYSSYFYQPEIRQVSVPGVTGPEVQTRQYRYDNLGRLRLTVDPTGRREFFLYDTANRRVANVDNDGTVTEYRYDGNDNVTSTTRYANRLTAGQLDNLEITDQPLTITPTGASLLTNGSFETSGTYTLTPYGRSNSTLPGWTKTNSEGFEQVAAGQLGVTGTDGAYWLDLDSYGITGYTATGSNLLTNGSFDTSGSYTTISTGRSNTTLPGWSKTNGETFEQVTSGQMGVTASNGGYWLDLESVQSGTSEVTGSNQVALGGWPGDPNNLPSGNATVTGWQNPTNNVTETIWASVPPPGGGANVVAMRTGQTDADAYGGGNTTNAITIDETKKYEFTYYFRLTTVGVHDIAMGLNPSPSVYVLSATDGMPNADPYFFALTAAGQTAVGMVQNKWYKVVGYVLPEGSANISASAMGGIYDATTGARLGNAANFRWNPSRPNDTIYSRMGVGNGSSQVYSADWLKPELREISVVPGGGGNMDISQTVSGRTAGEVMQIQFDHANRTTSASGSFEVYWNNTLIDTITSTGATMQGKTYQVAAVAGNNTLRFKSLGTVDAAGASLDNVRLFATTPAVTGGNMDISQSVSGLTAGQVMQLKFDHANRTTSASGSFEVYWNNVLVSTVNSTGTNMVTDTLNLTAAAGTNTLRFKGTGTVDVDGASLDNVRLYATTQSSSPLLGLADVRPLADPDNDVWTFNVYDAAQRLVQTIDGLGATSVLSYDGASRLVSTTSYANRVSAANLAVLKARAVNPNYWSNANNGSWGVGNLSITAAGTIDGANAYQLSVITGGAWNGLVGDGIPAVAYDAATVTLSLKAVGSVTTAEFGLYGYVSGWGGNAESSAIVVSGPGAVSQHAGGLFYLSGLSTTVATRITLSRSLTQAENVQPYLYIKTTDFPSVAAGDSLIAAAPVLTFNNGSPVFLPTADSANDRVARSFYDNDGRLIGTLDAEGYLAKTVYDKAGRQIETIGYSAATNPALRASGTFAQLASGLADNAKDAHNWFLYDARGLVRASVDSEGGLTRMSYNPLGELAYVETGQKLDPLALIATPPTLANLPSAPGGTVLQTVNHVRDAYGHVVSETRSLTGAATTTTAYSYDNMYRLTATTTQSGGPDTRVMRQRYDLRGNVIGTLNGIGSAALAALGGSPTQAQIDAVWADHGTTLTYDRADRLLSSTDPNGNRALYYYDTDGRLAFEIDPLGQVTGHVYDSHGRQIQVIVYETPLASYSGMNGGDVTATLLVAIGNIASASDTSVFTAYNVDGTVKQVTDPNSVVTAVTYNGFRETATRIEASGTGIARTTTYAYDRRGMLKTEVFDAGTGSHRNVTTTYGYDAFGRAITLTNALNKVATSTYDRKGRLKTQTVSPNGGATLYTTTYHYDARDNLVAVTDATGAITRNVYDKAGRRIATIDARGGVTTITYDADGRAVATRAYANLLAGVGALPTEVTETALSLPSTNAADHVTRFSYDKDGRLRFTIDGLMHVVENVYDQNGNVIRTIAYNGTIAPADYLEATVATAVSALAAAPGNQITRAVYDSANRAVYAIDALDQVIWSKYDRKGQLVKQVELAATYTAGGDPSKSTMDGWLTSYGNETNDRTTRAYYDKAGQLLYSIDARGFVTRFEYDALGNVSKQWRYPDAYSALDTTTVANLNAAFASPPAGTRLTQFSYDTAGRLEQTIDPENYVTKLTTDAVGQVLTSTAAFGTGAASTTAYTYDDVGRMVKEVRGSGASEASTSWFYYNGVGRQTAAVDPGNYLSVLTYDEVGNLLTQTHYANAITGAYDGNTLVTALQALAGTNAGDTQSSTAYDAFGRVTTATDARGSVVSNGYDILDRLLNQNQQMEAGSGDDRITVYAYDNFGNVEWITDPRGNQSHSIYDKLNRVVRQSNALYYHTDTTYSRGGRIASVKVWATGAAGHLAVGTNPSSSAGDAVTTFTYNKRDELTATTDAMNYTESYTLNAFGERTEFRNKLHVAGTFDTTVTYTYDKRGLLLTETLPVTTKTSGGATISVVNSYSYDARGNRTQMIEAAGAAEARTTGYSYDKLDRLTATTHDSVTVVNANLTSSTNVAVAETAVYDTRGNVIKTTDAAGAQSFFYYDHLGRVIAEIGPVGTLSVYGYDKNGNRTSVRAYDAAVSLPGSPGGAPPSGTGASRLVSYAYDRSNRLTTTTVSGLQTGEYAAGAWSFSSTDIVSTMEYDKAGNVIHQEDGRGSDVYFWYDQLGRQIAQIDAENYLTIWQRDAEGNAVAETRYASKITGSFTTATPAYGGLLALVTANNALDRTTTFTYDANGRRTSERRWYVDASTVSGTGSLGTSSQTAIIQYSYDGLGNVLARTEANYDQTTYAYDKIGRLALETGQAFTDHLGATVAPRTAYAYDGLNNIRSVRRQATATPNDTNDRITAYTYGAGGRLATMTDAAGFVHSYGYDVAGRLVRDSYVRTKSDGTSVTEAQVTRYDTAGRAITQTLARDTGSGWVFTNEAGTAYDAIRMDYNVHGELIGRGLTAGPDAAAVYQETFSYDLGGRLWKSNEGDGVLRFFVYDKAGNKTLTLASTGDDLSGLVVSNYTSSITGTGDTSLGSSVTTIATFDKRGQQLGLIEPDRQRTASGTATITRSNTYNAYGEVLTEVDGRGYTTTFTYNVMGRLASRVSPQVSITAENGAVSNATPTENYYYDISGRLVGVRDANAIMDAANHMTTRLLLAGTGHGKDAEPLVLKEFHADYNGTTGAIVTKYDVFGDARAQINEIGSTETRDFDKMGRLVVQYHPVRAAGSIGNPGAAVQLIDYYAYDGFGQRIQHWNSQFSEYVKERTDYDAQGRVVSTIAFDGGAFTYAYAWNGGLTTSGMSAWGGWTKVTTNVAAGRWMTDVEDYFGHAIDQVDYGGHDYAFTYDWGGRLIARGNYSGESIGYSWYNTGLAAGQTGTQGVASYEYDANGNRTKEIFSKGGLSYRNANATYDAMGRMTHWDDTGYGGYAPASSDWQYDAVGNVRSVSSSYRALDSQGYVAGSSTPQTYWYLYDNMNRFTLTKGTLTGTPGSGTIERGSEGTLISYYADGSRATALYTGQVYYTYWQYSNPEGPPILPGPIEVGEGGGEEGYVWTTVTHTGPGDRREDYFYTADGYLAETRKADAWVDPGPDPSTNGNVPAEPIYYGPPAVGSLVSQTTRDALGRVTWYKEYGGFDGSFERTGISYDNAGRQLGETNFTIRRDTPGAVSSTYKTIVANYYAGGVLTKSTQDTYKWDNGDNQYKDSAVDDSLQIYSYAWWDGAVQSSIGNDKNWGGNLYSYSIDWTTAYTLDGSGHVSSVYIDDGRNRNVSFVVDQNGQIAHRDEDDNTSGGDPRALRYFFAGQQFGMVTNNGTDNLQYTSAVKDRLLPLATSDTGGAFRGGSKTARPYADFEQSYDAINGYVQDDTASPYTINEGDTLQSIALAVWGDANLWYLIADANGLTNSSQLVTGQLITLPNKIRNNRNSADTFRPYDPNEALGNLSPTSPKSPKKPKCGVLGQIISVIVAAVTSQFGILGNVVSQGVNMLLGIQDKFSWKSLGMAAITSTLQAFTPPGMSGLASFAFNVGTNIVAQGIGVVTGLQKKFDWASVAGSAISSGIQLGLSSANLPSFSLSHPTFEGFAASLGTKAFTSVFKAAARSAIDGTSFGDNILAELPDVIGGTIGGALSDWVGNKLASRFAGEPSITVGPAPAVTVGPAADGSGNIAYIGGAPIDFSVDFGIGNPPDNILVDGWPELGIAPLSDYRFRIAPQLPLDTLYDTRLPETESLRTARAALDGASTQQQAQVAAREQQAQIGAPPPVEPRMMTADGINYNIRGGGTKSFTDMFVIQNGVINETYAGLLLNQYTAPGELRGLPATWLGNDLINENRANPYRLGLVLRDIETTMAQMNFTEAQRAQVRAALQPARDVHNAYNELADAAEWELIEVATFGPALVNRGANALVDTVGVLSGNETVGEAFLNQIPGRRLVRGRNMARALGVIRGGSAVEGMLPRGIPGGVLDEPAPPIVLPPTVSTPAPAPRRQPSGRPPPILPLPVQTGDDNNDGPVGIAPDSNVFMSTVEGGPPIRSILDTVIDHPLIGMTMSRQVQGEVKPNRDPAGIARMARATGRLSVIDVDMSGIDIGSMTSRTVSINDIYLLETARQNNLAVVTANSALRNQVLGDKNRPIYQRYHQVPILIPGTHFSNGEDLVRRLRATGR